MEERTTDPAAAAGPDIAPEPPAEPVAPAPWYRRRNPLIAAAAVVIAAGVGLGFALSGGNVSVHGSVDMGELTYLDETPGADVTNPTPGDACTASTGYNVSAGTTVTIGGANGQPVAVAALSEGKVNAAGYCEFDFTASVPEEGTYTATLGQHGTTTWTKAQATSKAGMTLSLTYAG